MWIIEDREVTVQRLESSHRVTIGTYSDGSRSADRTVRRGPAQRRELVAARRHQIGELEAAGPGGRRLAEAPDEQVSPSARSAVPGPRKSTTETHAA